MKTTAFTGADHQELLTNAENQYSIVEKMYELYQKSLDFDFYDLYITQLAVYAQQIQKIHLTDPQFIELKLKAVLVEANKLWPEHGNEWITAELVAKVALLLDTAKALGWKQPLPETSVYSCEVCGYKGYLGVDIVEREYYDRVFKRDSTRWECKDIEGCLDRIGR